jgi:hypothetical protein
MSDSGLLKMEALDFAGGNAVHLSSGIAALAVPNCLDAAGGLAGLARTTIMITPAVAGLSWQQSSWVSQVARSAFSAS